MKTKFLLSKARRAFDVGAVAVISSGRQWVPAAALVVAMALVLAPDALVAGTGGTEFDNVWTWLVDVTQGTLGRILAGAMVLVGVVGGIAGVRDRHWRCTRPELRPGHHRRGDVGDHQRGAFARVLKINQTTARPWIRGLKPPGRPVWRLFVVP